MKILLYIVDVYINVSHHPEIVISRLAYFLPFFLADILQSDKWLWLILLSPALEGVAVFIFHWLFKV